MSSSEIETSGVLSGTIQGNEPEAQHLPSKPLQIALTFNQTAIPKPSEKSVEDPLFERLITEDEKRASDVVTSWFAPFIDLAKFGISTSLGAIAFIVTLVSSVEKSLKTSTQIKSSVYLFLLAAGLGGLSMSTAYAFKVYVDRIYLRSKHLMTLTSRGVGSLAIATFLLMLASSLSFFIGLLFLVQHVFSVVASK